MKGALTLVSSHQPASLGKVFSLTADGLHKETAGQMVEGEHQTLAFEGVDDLASILACVKTHQAIMSSLPRDGRTSGGLVTRTALPENPDALARTKEHFGFPVGQAGVLVGDYDPAPGVPALTRDGLWDAACSVMPALKEAGVVWCCSGSSHIYSGGVELQGLRGQRLYVLMQDLSDLERAGEVLAKRLWLAGHGRVMVSKSGSALKRSLFDEAMHQPARLDFIGGAVCKPPLEQRRGKPVVLSRGGWLDTRTAIPDLTPAEEAQYEDMVEAAKRAAAPEIERARAAWRAKRKVVMVTRLLAAGVAATEAEERAQRTLESALRGVLLGDYEIVLDSGEVVTVGEILDNRAKYHNTQTKDAVEPDYQNGKTCGILYLYGASPVLSSRAHGGQTFRLIRQPARLYIQRGGKAGLVDAIRERMAQESDIFVRGGCLVRVEGGRTRLLTRPALLHLVSSRCAFFTRNDKGVDMPVDLPGDVVDMLLATV